jgi:hypothetical protein
MCNTSLSTQDLGSFLKLLAYMKVYELPDLLRSNAWIFCCKSSSEVRLIASILTLQIIFKKRRGISWLDNVANFTETDLNRRGFMCF